MYKSTMGLPPKTTRFKSLRLNFFSISSRGSSFLFKCCCHLEIFSLWPFTVNSPSQLFHSTVAPYVLTFFFILNGPDNLDLSFLGIGSSFNQELYNNTWYPIVYQLPRLILRLPSSKASEIICERGFKTEETLFFFRTTAITSTVLQATSDQFQLQRHSHVLSLSLATWPSSPHLTRYRLTYPSIDLISTINVQALSWEYRSLDTWTLTPNKYLNTHVVFSDPFPLSSIFYEFIIFSFLFFFYFLFYFLFQLCKV